VYFLSPVEFYSKIAAKFQREEMATKKTDLPKYTAMKMTLVKLPLKTS
jgi:hypothetical protein